MKTICVVVFLALLPCLAHGTVGTPASPPDDTQEALTLTIGTLVTLGNVATVATKSPSYWVGALGLASGITALAMSAQDDTVHQNGLLIVGALGVASGAAALRYRYVLNHEKTQARVEPTWHAGSPGLALIIDF